jgi:hypothetical protein
LPVNSRYLPMRLLKFLTNILVLPGKPLKSNI